VFRQPRWISNARRFRSLSANGEISTTNAPVLISRYGRYPGCVATPGWPWQGSKRRASWRRTIPAVTDQWYCPLSTPNALSKHVAGSVKTDVCNSVPPRYRRDSGWRVTRRVGEPDCEWQIADHRVTPLVNRAVKARKHLFELTRRGQWPDG
jgi:hypothetical protein